ncbi:Putative thiosulfate sulfurtransferase [Halomonas sp. THAF5a]|uniref:sulfurtransferase n=1 Tax=Halomonas sp. THAF5a TaxID=2587844 RepID=UPI0012692762|nr:sulfurtransferase [Halomonas sp. THAF5a]QFU01928.1 Putative thiosulfate sulfurtransferase [Halomonas sp. THAF5a]
MIKSVFMGLGLALAASRAVAAEVSPLVEADWLAERLGHEDLVVLDVRSSIDDGGDRAGFEAAHIPGSVYSSYTEAGWRETRNEVAGLLPSVESLEALIGGLGIDNDDTVVIVPAGTGATDFGSAARIYWTFKVLGHDEVAILDGGFAGWQAQQHEIASGATPPPDAADFQGRLDPTLIATTEEVQAARESQAQLVDARPADYFRGETQSPAATAPGTIPGARNLPFHRLLTQRQQAWYLDDEVLGARINDAELDRGAPTVAFCNTGHWAAIDWFVLSEVAGFDRVRLYDGSMAEWTRREDLPLALAE